MMKTKTLALLIGLLLACGASAQNFTVYFQGILSNTNGTVVPITVQTAPGFTPIAGITVNTDANGFFSDSLAIFSNPVDLEVSFTDCHGNTVMIPYFIQFPPILAAWIQVTADYCTNVIDCLGVPGGPNLPGFACVDSTGATGTWGQNCNCMTGMDCLGIVGGSNLPGTACIDTTTGFIGIWDPNCLCQSSTGTVDCLGVPGGTAMPGTFCTDSLGNGGIWAPNCVCLTNTPPTDCLGIPGGTAYPGTACVDPTTGVTGIWDPNCVCQTGGSGTIDCLGIPGGTALPGTFCIDTSGNQGTWDANCSCIANGGNPGPAVIFVIASNTGGQPIQVTLASCDSTTQPPFTYTATTDSSGTFVDTLSFTSATACISVSFTDCNGNVVTQPFTQSTSGSPVFFFTIDWCPGSTVDCLGVPGGTALPGTPCATAIGGAGIWDQNCSCIPNQGSVDCLGIPNGTALPGTPCIDSTGLPGFWDPNCVCFTGANLPDCNGVVGGPDVPGAPCDDLDPNTSNDTWDFNCNCVGYAPSLDCNGVLGGPDVPGAPCNDNDSLTFFDHYDWNCNCTGIPINPNNCNAQFFAFQSYDSTGTIIPNSLNVVTLFSTPFFGGGNLNYLWDFGDGNTSTLPFPSHTYSGVGPYNLCVTVSDSTCSDTYCDSIAIDTSGIIIRGQTGFHINMVPALATEVQEQPTRTDVDYTLFPNPAMDEVSLTIFEELSGNVSVSFFDVSGKLVLNNTFRSSNGSETRLDIKKLDAGVYFVKVDSDNRSTTKRLVKATR